MENRILKWQKDGLITEDASRQMLAEIKEEKIKLRKTRINITIYTIAAILLGLGVITFISANDWILELLNSNRFLKIILMSLVTFASFMGGVKLKEENKKFPKLANALIVLSSILIGATYSVIGQIYNINANSSLLMFIWLLSILPLAYIFKSYAINVLSIILMILTIIFFYGELSLDKFLVWTIFIPVMCGSLLYTVANIPVVLNKYNDFSLCYKIVGSVAIYFTLIVLTCSVEKSYQMLSFYYLAPVLAVIVLNVLNYAFKKDGKENDLLYKESFAGIILLSFMLAALLAPVINSSFVIFLANVAIIVLVAFGFNYGYKFENENIISVANWMLTIYVAVNYCRWGWNYMNKSLFFIFGGVVLLVLGMYLEKKKKALAGLGKEG